MTSKKRKAGICEWCGKSFTKNHNREMYCCDTCRREARHEHERERSRRYYKRWKITIRKRCPHGAKLGTGSLSANRNHDMDREGELVKNEIKRLHITIYDYSHKDS